MWAGHEDFGDSMAAYMDSGKAQTYLEGRSLLFVASLGCGSSVSERIAIDVAA